MAQTANPTFYTGAHPIGSRLPVHRTADGTAYVEIFTYYLCKNINESQYTLTYKELLTRVRADLKKGKYSQTPQLETEATRRSSRLG